MLLSQTTELSQYRLSWKYHLIEFQHGSVARRTRTLCKEVTIKKAGSALLSFADFKGPGMDAIYPAMIKESKNRLL